jgi:hypothetical protein
VAIDRRRHTLCALGMPQPGPMELKIEGLPRHPGRRRLPKRERARSQSVVFGNASSLPFSNCWIEIQGAASNHCLRR